MPSQEHTYTLIIYNLSRMTPLLYLVMYDSLLSPPTVIFHKMITNFL